MTDEFFDEEGAPYHEDGPWAEGWEDRASYPDAAKDRIAFRVPLPLLRQDDEGLGVFPPVVDAFVAHPAAVVVRECLGAPYALAWGRRRRGGVPIPDLEVEAFPAGMPRGVADV